MMPLIQEPIKNQRFEIGKTINLMRCAECKHKSECEGKRGVVAKVSDNVVLVTFPAVEEGEGRTYPLKLYFYEDTLDKVSLDSEG